MSDTPTVLSEGELETVFRALELCTEQPFLVRAAGLLRATMQAERELRKSREDAMETCSKFAASHLDKLLAAEKENADLKAMVGELREHMKDMIGSLTSANCAIRERWTDALARAEIDGAPKVG